MEKITKDELLTQLNADHDDKILDLEEISGGRIEDPTCFKMALLRGLSAEEAAARCIGS